MMETQKLQKTRGAKHRAPIRELTHRDKCVLALLDDVKPTHFVTLSLCQGRKISTERGMQVWIRGDDAIYRKAYDGFIRSLSKQFASRTEWVRDKPLLRNAGAIEGGSNGRRNHIHLIIAKPAEVSEERFRMAICRAAAGNPWIMDSDHAVDIQKLEDGRAVLNSTFYSMKRGTDRLC